MADRILYLFVNIDGRHSILSRDEAPKNKDVISSIPKEYSGWIVRMEGNYHSKRRKLSLDVIQDINYPSISWEEAKETFLKIRKAS